MHLLWNRYMRIWILEYHLIELRTIFVQGEDWVKLIKYHEGSAIVSCRDKIWKKMCFMYFILFLTKVIKTCLQQVISPCVFRTPTVSVNWNKSVSSFLLSTIILSKQEDILVNKVISLSESSLDQKKKKTFSESKRKLKINEFLSKHETIFRIGKKIFSISFHDCSVSLTGDDSSLRKIYVKSLIQNQGKKHRVPAYVDVHVALRIQIKLLYLSLSSLLIFK